MKKYLEDTNKEGGKGKEKVQSLLKGPLYFQVLGYNAITINVTLQSTSRSATKGSQISPMLSRMSLLPEKVM